MSLKIFHISCKHIFLMLVFICVENIRILFLLLVWRHYEFRARNNHCGTIAHKIGTSATYFLRCMKIKRHWAVKSNGIGCSEKLDINGDFFFVLVPSIMLTWNSLFLFFYYLRQGTAFLEDGYFVLHGHQKRRSFICKS